MPATWDPLPARRAAPAGRRGQRVGGAGACQWIKGLAAAGCRLAGGGGQRRADRADATALFASLQNFTSAPRGLPLVWRGELE